MIFELILFLLFVRPIIRLFTYPLFGYRRPPMGPPPMMGPHFHHMHHHPHMHHHMHGPRF